MGAIELEQDEARGLTEYEALLVAAPTVLDAIPAAVYICRSDGLLMRHNRKAVELWGRTPRPGDTEERFCGAHRLFLPNGRPLPHADTPMALALRTGEPAEDLEVVIERPDGSRLVALVNIRALKDAKGRVQGAINCFQDITARKMADTENLRRREELEDFFENSAVGLHIVGPDGTILRANQAELALLGYSAEEYVGRSIADFHADADTIADILRRLSARETLDRYPARLRAKDGSIRHVLITSSGRFSGERFINTRCFTVDVTDLHQANAARRESDERLAATYDNAMVGIAETDATGRFLRVNGGLSSISGYSREELLARGFTDLTHPDDLQADLAEYARLITGEIDRYSLEKRYLRKDGTIAEVTVSGSCVRDAAGQFRYGVRVVQDVTERKRMEEQLRDSERRVRELLEALPVAVYTTDAEGWVTFHNAAAASLAGRAPELGRDRWCISWRIFLPDGTEVPKNECWLAVALREGRPIRNVEAVIERPDGQRIPIIPYPTPLCDARGALVGAVNVLVDISDRKSAENRQKVLIDELNHRVKNTLATVQSLAAQTARHTPAPDEFIRTFHARLMALARAHDLLTRRHWEEGSLRDILSEVLAPHIDSAERMLAEGPAVSVDPRTALALTMTFHELATNAAKYGALSMPAGRLTVRWELKPQANGAILELEWKELAGRPVRPPARRGFGTRFIERSIRNDLNGKLELHFDPSGLRCWMNMPVPQRLN